MISEFRQFQVSDPFGRQWNVAFLWQQNGISIRHADTVDVKFELSGEAGRMTKVVALYHPALLELSAKTGRPVTDSWCSRLAALHLREMIETGEDMDKTLVTPGLDALERHHAALEETAVSRR